MRALLKEGDAHFMIKYAVRVRRQMQPGSLLAGFFLPATCLCQCLEVRPRRGAPGLPQRLRKRSFKKA